MGRRYTASTTTLIWLSLLSFLPCRLDRAKPSVWLASRWNDMHLKLHRMKSWHVHQTLPVSTVTEKTLTSLSSTHTVTLMVAIPVYSNRLMCRSEAFQYKVRRLPKPETLPSISGQLVTLRLWRSAIECIYAGNIHQKVVKLASFLACKNNNRGPEWG